MSAFRRTARASSRTRSTHPAPKSKPGPELAHGYKSCWIRALLVSVRSKQCASVYLLRSRRVHGCCPSCLRHRAPSLEPPPEAKGLVAQSEVILLGVARDFVSNREAAGSAKVIVDPEREHHDQAEEHFGGALAWIEHTLGDVGGSVKQIGHWSQAAACRAAAAGCDVAM